VWIKVLKSKIHRATVTQADLDYIGSITIDERLCREAGIAELESVLVADLDNGTRHETYAMYGPEGSGTICVNGAAARLVQPGEKIIIMAFAYLQPDQLPNHKARVIVLGKGNTVESTIEYAARDLTAAG